MENLASIILKAQNGDRRAFDEIVHRFQAMACGYAYSVLGSFHFAEDAAQEAFVEAYQELSKLREPLAFPGWFRRIVFKHCDRITRAKGPSSVPLEQMADVPSDQPGPDIVTERSDLRAHVLAAICELPQGERAATVLHYISGYSTVEVGVFLGVPPGTVKSRLYAARRKLRERLAEMVEETIKQSCPDEGFARRVKEAIEVYGAKGPNHDHMGSEWDQALRRKTSEIIGMGEEGVRVAEAMAKSENAKARQAAALVLGLSHSDESRDQLVCLMRDQSAKVREHALRWYALLIHPRGNELNYWAFFGPAGAVPDSIEHIVHLVTDANERVRTTAVNALSSYMDLGDPRVNRVLTSALEDEKHKVKHAAAGALGVECHGCGSLPRRAGAASDKAGP